jgi:hypothetical protein
MTQWLPAFVICVGAVTPAFAQEFDGLAETAPMGWNSWNTFASHINERRTPARPANHSAANSSHTTSRPCG